ncbi:MAG: hypothetical protein HOH43_02630 [Candidatus Latescibacteria bacterium]|nr:hypothetical protein [Candidatus Latescibacterota bacterium]
MGDTGFFLDDVDMQRYLMDGFISTHTCHEASFHARIYDQIDSLYTTEGNPGNNILAKVPDLYGIMRDSAVDHALQSLLGQRYVLHPHRHCHLNPAGSKGQRQHKDSYEADENVRHHKSRWAMAFYYPQDVDEEMGPSSILRGSQYYMDEIQAHGQPEIPLCGPAGTVVIVHYDLWHRAMPNISEKDRYMVKFLFCRTSEPRSPSWDNTDPLWRVLPEPTVVRPPENLCKHMWTWHQGIDATVTPSAGNYTGTVDQISDASESNGLHAAYAIDGASDDSVTDLIDLLRIDGETHVDSNLASPHTNPCEFRTSHALSALGGAAVPALTDLLQDDNWLMRATAADILGDIGAVAEAALPHLVVLSNDESEWVRRNVAEALGNIGIAGRGVVETLIHLLDDPVASVGLNAVYSIGKIGTIPEQAKRALRNTASSSDEYLKSYAELLLAPSS